MSEKDRPDYHLGYTDAEHERLIRQAARLEFVTERFFREAGVVEGWRILDVGSGAGDVAMLAARIVGPSGAVVGLERDPRSVERARTRAAELGLANIAFVCCDVDEYAAAVPFDGAVGRFVLQFIPDPVATLRRVASFVRTGGLIAFQEGSWAPFLALSAGLPLWHACVSLLHGAARRAGVNLEMGIDLDRVFRAAGLAAPKVRLEMELGRDPEFTRWPSDSLRSVLPDLTRLGVSYDELGDLDTLAQRLHEEVTRANTVAPWIGLVGASSYT
ncbi:MAG TPA: class I SAM-dependent methyltransferase [Candidatus Nitrosotalea sp.]|nr:class I SAM-dependent methyltransferase [Candidatus Nitrosotalea sp.]